MIISFDISKSNLMKLGLLMGADSRKRREYLGEALRIGVQWKAAFKSVWVFGIIRGARSYMVLDCSSF